MASRGIINTNLVILLVAMWWARATAQSDSCSNVIISLAPCLNFVSGSSSTPSSSCCSQLASVVRSQPQCLCTVLNGGGASLGVTINQTLALALPAACNVQTPPVSKCNAADGPAMYSADSPGGLPGGSKATPTTAESSSGGLNIDTILQMALFAMFMASCGSTFSSFF
ncbi:non-specific lipid transfer protein GPI-anchored 5-like [Mercurialis annua]|uniref:non-specific lipid transfer protein GPI-anchored 5-like n=1 Tax=Mercurialis annua TaxID=3986 RepID=UPI00215E4264|nr:non-specific lipid transfer protein GPI-anchored 5-like [Mercurialis annua]